MCTLLSNQYIYLIQVNAFKYIFQTYFDYLVFLCVAAIRERPCSFVLLATECKRIGLYITHTVSSILCTV